MGKKFRLGNFATSGKWQDALELLKTEKKLNVEGKNTVGNSSLLIAAARGHTKTLAVLLGAGSNPNQRFKSHCAMIVNPLC